MLTTRVWSVCVSVKLSTFFNWLSLQLIRKSKLTVKYINTWIKSSDFSHEKPIFLSHETKSIALKIHSLILKYIIEKRFCLPFDKVLSCFLSIFQQRKLHNTSSLSFGTIFPLTFFVTTHFLKKFLQQLPTNLTLVSWFSLQLNATHVTRTFFFPQTKFNINTHTGGVCCYYNRVVELIKERKTKKANEQNKK